MPRSDTLERTDTVRSPSLQAFEWRAGERRGQAGAAVRHRALPADPGPRPLPACTGAGTGINTSQQQSCNSCCCTARAHKTAKKLHGSVSPCQEQWRTLTWPDCKHLPCPSDGRSSTFPIPPNFAKTFPYCRRGMPAACAAALSYSSLSAGRQGGLLQRKANQDACLAAVGFKGHAAQSLFGVFDGHGPVGVLLRNVLCFYCKSCTCRYSSSHHQPEYRLETRAPNMHVSRRRSASTAAKRGRSLNPRSNPVGTV